MLLKIMAGLPGKVIGEPFGAHGRPQKQDVDETEG
jgi:hypothetical protein